MRSLTRGLLIAVIAVVVTLAAIEGGIRWGSFFEAERRMVGGDGGGTDPVAEQAMGLPGAVLHPYLGYTQRPGTSQPPPSPEQLARFFGDDDALRRYNALPAELRAASVNAQGFTSHIRDYRQISRSQWVIGIFGGSVADVFAGALRLGFKADLARALGVSEESIEIVNFAKGGYRQPQQLIALIEAVLSRIPLDLVVNLDGFNEVAMGAIECSDRYDPLFPSAMQYVPLVSSVVHGSSRPTLEAILRLRVLREREARLRAAVAQWPLCDSEAVKAAGGAMVSRWSAERLAIERDLQHTLAKNPETELPILLPLNEEPGGNCAETCTEIWERSSAMMDVIARQAGATYLHVLQPNQYVPDSKRLSSEELAVAWSPHLRAAEAVRAGYPILQKRIADLRAHGVEVLDLTSIFAEVSESVYLDQCCHMNYRGNRLMYESLAPAIARAKSAPKP